MSLSEENRDEAYNILVSNNKLGEMQGLVFSVIHKNPDSTDNDIARLLGYDDKNKVRPRRNELAEMGLIIASGTKVDSKSNMGNTTWRVAYKGDMKEKVKNSYLTNAEMVKLEKLIYKANNFQITKIKEMLK